MRKREDLPRRKRGSGSSGKIPDLLLEKAGDPAFV
jgi:hypothetical protein